MKSQIHGKFISIGIGIVKLIVGIPNIFLKLHTPLPINTLINPNLTLNILTICFQLPEIFRNTNAKSVGDNVSKSTSSFQFAQRYD